MYVSCINVSNNGVNVGVLYAMGLSCCSILYIYFYYDLSGASLC